MRWLDYQKAFDMVSDLWIVSMLELVKEADNMTLWEKRLHGKFMMDVSEVADERSWQWLRAGYLTKSMEDYAFCCSGAGFLNEVFWATIEREDVHVGPKWQRRDGVEDPGCTGSFVRSMV